MLSWMMIQEDFLSLCSATSAARYVFTSSDMIRSFKTSQSITRNGEWGYDDEDLLLSVSLTRGKWKQWCQGERKTQHKRLRWDKKSKGTQKTEKQPAVDVDGLHFHSSSFAAVSLLFLFCFSFIVRNILLMMEMALMPTESCSLFRYIHSPFDQQGLHRRYVLLAMSRYWLHWTVTQVLRTKPHARG